MKVELISITPDAEKVIESAGRTSYQSFSYQNQDTEKKFIKMLIRNGHFSVLEHGTATFRIKNVSRALTHQLVRHRLCSFTQQSQRYVNEKEFNYILPETIKSNSEAKEIFEKFITFAQETYRELQKMGIKNEDARFVLPNATSSEIVITANFREWRHIIELRGHIHAQWEIRNLIIKIYQVLSKHAPTVFFDYSIDKKRNIIIHNQEQGI